jgi:hypothetical protein
MSTLGLIRQDISDLSDLITRIDKNGANGDHKLSGQIVSVNAKVLELKARVIKIEQEQETTNANLVRLIEFQKKTELNFAELAKLLEDNAIEKLDRASLSRARSAYEPLPRTIVDIDGTLDDLFKDDALRTENVSVHWRMAASEHVSNKPRANTGNDTLGRVSFAPHEKARIQERFNAIGNVKDSDARGNLPTEYDGSGSGKLDG